MVNNNQQQEKPQDFELMELLFGKVDSSTSDSLDKSFEARYQSLVDQIQSYLHSSEKPGFFPHRFLSSFASVLDTKLNDKLGIKKLHFRFEGARTLKIVAETESKIHVFIFTEDVEAQHSKLSDAHTRSFEFTTGEWKNVMGRDYTELDARKLQIDVIKILKDKYELVKSKPKSDKDVKSKKLYLYLKNNVLECKAKDINGNIQTMQIDSGELKGDYAFKSRFFDEIKQFLGKSGKDFSDDVGKELSRITSAKGYTLKSNGEDTKINIKVESNKKIKDIPIPPPTEFPFKEVKKKLGKSLYLEDYIEKLVNSDTRQAKENLEDILNYIKKVHTNLDLQDNVYGTSAREADQHGFVTGIFDNFRYRDNTKIYLEQFAGGGYADIVLLVRGPDRAVDSVPILIELKAGTEGQVDPNDALEQAKGYIEGFRQNKMRILTNADNAIAVGLNLDNAEPFKTEVKPIKQPPAPLMEEFVKLAHRWNNQQISEEDFKQEIAGLLSSEYHTFPANKETKDHYYFSRDILGQSILINKIGQDQDNVKKYIYSYNEYPLNWPQGTEYTLSKSPVTTLIFVQGNEGQEKTAFIFHIRESNTKEFYADKKIPVLNIPGIGEVKDVIETKMSLRKYETGLSFEELFEIEQISKYNPSGADQQFTGSFLKIPNSDELKAKLDQAITSQHASDGEVSLQAYKVLLSEVADTVYPIKDLITNEARLQAVLNGLLSSYSDLKLKETSTKQQDSAKTVIIPEFQVGAGGRVDMVIQGIGPSPQGTKEYTPIALEFKLIDKNLDEKGMKEEVDKLTKEQNVRYAKGAALKAITDSDKMFFMGVVVNVKAKDKNSLILTSDKFVPALVVHSSIDIAKRKHLEEIQEVTQRLKNIGIQEENLRTLESATAEKDYHYWLQQHDIADIARIQYGYGIDGADTLFEIAGSPEHIVNQLQQFQDSVTTRGERRPLTLIVNLDNNHWVTLVIAHQNGQYNGYYVDSLGNNVPDNIRQVLERARITVNDVSIAQQTDGHNCGLWALENAHSLNQMIANGYDSDWVRDLLLFNRNEAYFQEQRENISDRLSIDPQRIANLDEAILAETQANRKKFNLNSCVKPGGRSKRSVNSCLFSKDDIEKFSKGKVDENNVDKTIIDSEKFLTYVKNSQDEGKNAQLVEFVGDKSIEGDRKYLLDKVVGDQGYKRYVQNERIKDLHGDIVHQDSSLTKNQKLKSRLMSAAGGIQLIRGIHGAIVSCKDGTATDCGLNLGGIGWSFASQPIENVMVKITPRIVTSAEKVVGKIIPGTLGKHTKFVVRVAGVKFGSRIAKGAAGALAGVFDVVDIGMSASNLVDCKKRENSDDPCGGKEIRDNVASIAFSGVSLVSGIALAAAGMPVVGVAVGFGLIVGHGIYSGVSNIIEYEEKYDTTYGEDWSIFWRTALLQDMADDVQHLADRKHMVNSLAEQIWKALRNSPRSVVAYGIGLGKLDGNTIRPDYAKILMDKEDTNTKDLSRVIPDSIPGASRICLPKVTGQDYEKDITSSVQPPLYYCENAMVISHDGRNGKTIVYDLRNIDKGEIVGSNKWNNNFLIYPGTTKITGGNNVANRFVLVNNPSFLGKIIGGSNSINILDLSQLVEDKVTGVIDYRFKPIAYGKLKVRINDRLLIDDYVSNNLFNYHYIGRQNKVDEVLCMGYSEHFTEGDNRDVIIDSGGGVSRNKKDVVKNCRKVIISPYTTVEGGKSNYTFYVKTADYKGRGLYSEINVDGTGTVVFPEIDLLSDCDQITYSKESNTLSLKINLGQNDQFTLDIKNYFEQSSNKPHFVLIDKNGSNIVPKIERSDSATIKINSFELHSEYSLGNFDDVETHYNKILKNNKDYKVLGVIRGKTQNQNDSDMVFGSSGDDVINFDQGTMFARGGKGSDVYVITDGINNKEVKIDNNSDDEKMDTLFIPEVEKGFSIQKCDLHLNYSNISIQVKNYLQDHNHRHFIIMNKKGEAFIPNIQSMSCSSSGKGKLVPFLQATQTQNMFLLPKDFEDDHVVIDSHLEDIEKYKDKDDLLLIGEGEAPFIIRIEGFYTDRSKWENISYSLWNNNDLLPSPELLEDIDSVMEYQDKLRDDYKKVVKEYIIDFSNSTNIEHNQKLEKHILTFVGQEEERIGVMILKNVAPDQIEVSSRGIDLILRDKRSNHTVNIKGWNNNKSYRISTLEFDLGLEPITIRRLDRFSVYDIAEIQDLINKASENYRNKSKYTPKVETDFKCLISIDGFERENKEPTYQCLGFSSLQDQMRFTKNFCSLEQLSEFRNKSNSTQVSALSKNLQNNLSLNGYDQNIAGKCSKLILAGENNQQSKISSMVKSVEEFTLLHPIAATSGRSLSEPKNRLNLGGCLGHRRKRDTNRCLALWKDIDKFNEEKSEKRNVNKIKINSEIFVYYIKSIEDESKRVQFIDLASQVEVTGKFQGLVNKIVRSREAISHLNKVGKVSGILMHGMIAKNALADFLSGDYKGVAINLGFIAGGRELTKIVKVVNAKGIDFITDGKLLLGRSLKAASPFLARSTSAFVVYDLVNQIKELERGDKDALIPVIGDSIYLGADAAEIGIEVAEAFEVLEGVSSVTGPIGTAIGAVVFIGTDIYMAVKRVDKIDEIVHLTGGEKIIEGLRAFVGMKPEQYIEELMERKQLNDQLVKQRLEYLKEHNSIQRYVFPTKKSVVDSCETFTREIVGMRGHFKVLESERCKVKVQDDLDNVAFFDKKVSNVIYERAKPDNPNEGKLFCLPTDPIRPESGGESAYLCHDTIGLDYQANRTEDYTLITLGKGRDRAIGFKYSPNVFLVDDGDKDFTGGDKDDLFILVGNRVTGRLDGGGGNNTLNLAEFSLNENLNIKPDSRKNDSSISSFSNDIRIKNMNIIYGRKGKQDIVDCGCDVKYIDGQGGLSNNTPDNITIPYCYRPSEKKVIVRPSTEINNLDQSSNGNFDYIILPDKGKAKINIEPDFSLARQRKHNFLFNYTLFDLASVDIKNIKDINHWHAGYGNMTHTMRNVTFIFLSTLSKGKSINEKFDITISDIPANASYILSDNTEIKIGKNNLYAMHSTDKTIDEIVENYPTIADHLRMSLFISTKNETVVMGHGNHDIINNNFLQKSHLIGSGGENVYVITSGHEILDIENLPIPEVIIYDDFNKKNSLKDTLDLRQLVRQVNGDLSIEPISKIIEDRNDLLIKLSISAIALKQDVITVRLKDAFINNWYKELQVILNNAPMKISSELELKLLPLIFDKDKEIIIVTPQDVEEKSELIISKEVGQYTFLYSGYDLMITNVLNADIERNKFCTICLKGFYKQPKMETLSIRFNDTEILLSDEMDKINNADSINDYISSIVKLQESSTPSETASSHHPIRHKRHKDHNRHEDGMHLIRHRNHRVQKRNTNYQEYVDQLEIAASSGTRQSSWINGLFVLVKSSVNGLVSSVVNKISTKELENSKSGDTDACSAGLEKMYNATIPQSRKSLVVTKGNIPNRSWSSHQEKIRSNVTVAPEINTDVVNSVLILGDLAVRFMNGTSYQQPIHGNLLSPREQSMRSIDEDMIIRAIQQGKEKFGVPDTNMDEVEIIGNKTEIGK